jgi:hypothetical protein
VTTFYGVRGFVVQNEPLTFTEIRRLGPAKSPAVFASLEPRNYRDGYAGRRDWSYPVGVGDAARID